jgi:hypothetical protein
MMEATVSVPLQGLRMETLFLTQAAEAVKKTILSVLSTM